MYYESISKKPIFLYVSQKFKFWKTSSVIKKNLTSFFFLFFNNFKYYSSTKRFCFEAGSYYISQAGLRFKAVLPSAGITCMSTRFCFSKGLKFCTDASFPVAFSDLVWQLSSPPARSGSFPHSLLMAAPSQAASLRRLPCSQSAMCRTDAFSQADPRKLNQNPNHIYFRRAATLPVWGSEQLSTLAGFKHWGSCQNAKANSWHTDY